MNVAVTKKSTTLSTFLKLWKYIQPYKGPVIIAMILGLVMSGADGDFRLSREAIV